MIKPPIISFFINLLFLLQTLAPNKNNLVHETCKKCAERDPTLSYNFCITTFQSVPNINSSSNDVLKLGLITINLIRHNVTSTKRHVRTLLKNNKTLDPFVKTCLKDCYELYSEAVTTIKKVKKDYKAKLYDDANIEVSSVMEASTTCEDGFEEKEDVVLPLTKRNNDTFQLTAIALNIINMVRNKN